MERLKQRTVADLRRARTELLSLEKGCISYQSLEQWYNESSNVFERIYDTSHYAINSMALVLHRRYTNETDVDIFEDIRVSCIEEIDKAIINIDRTQIVRSVLEENILKVRDTKLSSLLLEFNMAKDISPNLAAIGFRTILSLIIKERAKKASPTSSLATSTDFAFEPSIKEALASNIFTSAENKLLKRFRDGGDFDAFNNITHKTGINTLIDKSRLDTIVNLLNTLLPTIF